jgi:hypothetical protein
VVVVVVAGVGVVVAGVMARRKAGARRMRLGKQTYRNSRIRHEYYSLNRIPMRRCSVSYHGHPPPSFGICCYSSL